MYNKTISFFGHRELFGNKFTIKNKLYKQTESLILHANADTFIMGSYGEFDRLALNVCLELKEKYPQIKIMIALTSLSKLEKIQKEDLFIFYNLNKGDIEYIIFDLENTFYKQKITITNQKIIEQSDIIICYIDEKKKISGSKKCLKYAQKLKKQIINLYEITDNPFYFQIAKRVQQEIMNLKK